MNTAAIILSSIGILILLIVGTISIVKHDESYMIFSIISVILLIFAALVNYPSPTESDIRDGKAIYVEEKNIGIDQNGDTIYNYNTYSLQWLPEWKYGRKH